MSDGVSVSLAMAFLAGIVSFLSPCVLPLAPSYVTFVTGLILVLAVPFFGFLVFLLFGSTSVGRKRLAQQEQVNLEIVERTPKGPVRVRTVPCRFVPLIGSEGFDDPGGG